MVGVNVRFPFCRTVHKSKSVSDVTGAVDVIPCFETLLNILYAFFVAPVPPRLSDFLGNGRHIFCPLGKSLTQLTTGVPIVDKSEITFRYIWRNIYALIFRKFSCF